MFSLLSMTIALVALPLPTCYATCLSLLSVLLLVVLHRSGTQSHKHTDSWQVARARTGCRDLEDSFNCEQWAKSGWCEVDPAGAADHCRLTCQLCERQPQPAFVDPANQAGDNPFVQSEEPDTDIFPRLPSFVHFTFHCKQALDIWRRAACAVAQNRTSRNGLVKRGRACFGGATAGLGYPSR